jgi:hypothetical protein
MSAATSKSNVISKGILVEVTNTETGTSVEYPSISAAARALNCSDTAILYNLRSLKKKPFKLRYIIKKL